MNSEFLVGPERIVDKLDEDTVKMLEAFNYLVPSQQTIIAALIFELATKDQQITDMAKHIMKIHEHDEMMGE